MLTEQDKLDAQDAGFEAELFGMEIEEEIAIK